MDCLTALQPYHGPRLHRFHFPADMAVFAVGDVHGCLHKLRELLDRLSDVHTPDRERVLVFLGDLVDRGPDTLGTLHFASRAVRDYGFDRGVHLPGNHELMMLDALEHLLADGRPEDVQAANWLRNGGATALAEAATDWERDPKAAARAFVAALPTWNGTPWLDMLRTAPSHLRVGDVLFVHAGVDPKPPLAQALGYGAHTHLAQDNHWAWIRKPFLEWPFGFAQEGRAAKNDPDARGVLVVHGHTAPPEVSSAWVEQPERLLRGHDRVRVSARVNLDGGAAQIKMVAGAVFTDKGWRLAAADGHH